MKKLILFSVILLGFTAAGFAQTISKNALGLRLGDSDGFGAEISYQRGISSNNRLEFDLGWRDSNHYDAFKLTGLYQWLFPLDGNFNWYVGAGGGIGSYDYDNDYNQLGVDDSGTFVVAAGDIGIEYNFNIPLLLSLDFRPELGFGDFNDDLDFDIALGIRYQF
ncbi:hypothetical protein [Robertkochia solimangrovi]|uniref:hypothetical protein n=1 Tax=Robertkochia solimangrovi TaxID=2213046 RepID=UPI00118110D7|nr:hypothetical protein [Robertkochia solimangrovi]TRZ45298.1 hypothetical protein DMZ48_06010 [Robertkochia solimangrovi]